MLSSSRTAQQMFFNIANRLTENVKMEVLERAKKSADPKMTEALLMVKSERLAKEGLAKFEKALQEAYPLEKGSVFIISALTTAKKSFLSTADFIAEIKTVLSTGLITKKEEPLSSSQGSSEDSEGNYWEG